MFEEGEKYWKKNYGGGSTAAQGYVYNKNQVKALTENPPKLESFPGCDATYRILEVMHSKCSTHHIELHLITQKSDKDPF